MRIPIGNRCGEFDSLVVTEKGGELSRQIACDARKKCALARRML